MCPRSAWLEADPGQPDVASLGQPAEDVAGKGLLMLASVRKPWEEMAAAAGELSDTQEPGEGVPVAGGVEASRWVPPCHFCIL